MLQHENQHSDCPWSIVASPSLSQLRNWESCPGMAPLHPRAECPPVSVCALSSDAVFLSICLFSFIGKPDPARTVRLHHAAVPCPRVGMSQGVSSSAEGSMADGGETPQRPSSASRHCLAYRPKKLILLLTERPVVGVVSLWVSLPTSVRTSIFRKLKPLTHLPVEHQC